MPARVIATDRLIGNPEYRVSHVPYFDGIMFDDKGNCLNGITPELWNRYMEVKTDMEKRIQTYCTKFRAAMRRGLPMPGAGDCFYCAMQGDVVEDPTHLLSHMDEDYFVPALAWNALRSKGYQDVGVYFHLSCDQETGTMGGAEWAARQTGMGGGMFRRDLGDYLKKRLVPEPPSERNNWSVDAAQMIFRLNER